MLETFMSHSFTKLRILPLDTVPFFDEVYAAIKPISRSYPGFHDWYYRRVVSGFLENTREIAVIRRRGQIAAVGIYKNDGHEKKICTVRVCPGFQRLGYGLRIMEAGMDWLSCDLPLATVSDDCMPSFQRIMDHYQFKLTQVCQNIYRRNRKEFVFNGHLTPSPPNKVICPESLYQLL